MAHAPTADKNLPDIKPPGIGSEAHNQKQHRHPLINQGETWMILLISVQLADLNSPVDDRFGRAAWFLRVDSDTLDWQALQNPGENNRGGAGVAAAQFAVDQKADVVISGDFGPNAAAALQAAGIQMLHFPSGGLTGQAVVQLYHQGALVEK
jgi:predicted Fe-Mo cluster-binding NifX family protein